jgi:methylthioribose-1-phosphate isomerase
MNIKGTNYTSLWYDQKTAKVFYIDQTVLPYELVIKELKSFDDGIRAIRDMEVRGAPLIGVTAQFAMYVGLKEFFSEGREDREGGEGVKDVTVGDGSCPVPSLCIYFEELAARLMATRPTAVNLAKAIDDLRLTIDDLPFTNSGIGYKVWGIRPDKGCLKPRTPNLEPVTDIRQLLHAVLAFRQAEIDRCRMIGENGLPLIEEISIKKDGATVNIMTHCNAGWLACVDYGTALAPIYLAYDKAIKVHVWVSETRPRNQGSKLTAFELNEHGVPCTVIVDNAAGHLMQTGEVDMILVGADRITRNGDVANKIGTYMKALAAADNNIPFYVAAPSTTFDEKLESGDLIPIEEREGREILYSTWLAEDCREDVRTKGGEDVTGVIDVPVRNPGFDVTPARLVTGYITEEGIHRRTTDDRRLMKSKK